MSPGSGEGFTGLSLEHFISETATPNAHKNIPNEHQTSNPDAVLPVTCPRQSPRLVLLAVLDRTLDPISRISKAPTLYIHIIDDSLSIGSMLDSHALHGPTTIGQRKSLQPD